MKDLLLMLLQITGVVCFIGFILSVIGILWGKPMYLKGTEVPADWRAAVSFLIAAAIIAGIFYLIGRKKKA
jgi:ABC-type antimicrobial peptide transport system permease subunit